MCWRDWGDLVAIWMWRDRHCAIAWWTFSWKRTTCWRRSSYFTSSSTTVVTLRPFASRTSSLILPNSLPIRSPASIPSEVFNSPSRTYIHVSGFIFEILKLLLTVQIHLAPFGCWENVGKWKKLEFWIMICSFFGSRDNNKFRLIERLVQLVGLVEVNFFCDFLK